MNGGKRNGAGRRKICDTPVMKSIKLRPEHWEMARSIGQGNAALGIRTALELAYRSSHAQQ